jgi:hypothetical protein
MTEESRERNTDRNLGIDRDLGEDRPIPRRDFLQGTLVAAAAALTGPLLKAYAADAADVGAGAGRWGSCCAASPARKEEPARGSFAVNAATSRSPPRFSAEEGLPVAPQRRSVAVMPMVRGR